MSRMSELHRQMYDEAEEWANDPIAQQEYQEWEESQKLTWSGRYPDEQEPLEA